MVNNTAYDGTIEDKNQVCLHIVPLVKLEYVYVHVLFGKGLSFDIYLDYSGIN
jgi:hypothetical protein